MKVVLSARVEADIAGNFNSESIDLDDCRRTHVRARRRFLFESPASYPASTSRTGIYEAWIAKTPSSFSIE